MSHLQRRYTDYFYREEGKKGQKRLIKVPYLTREDIMRAGRMTALLCPNAVFPCEHEKRDFLSKKGKKSNRTHARLKRKYKARAKKRKCA